MAKRVVTDYQVGWKLKDNVGGIAVKLESSEKYSQVPLSNVNEFHALLTLLQGPKAVYYDTEKKMFATIP